MVNTFGKDIVSAFTNGTPVKAIYTYGEKVWPITYYISWTPTNLSGSFSISGTTYDFEDYNGYFSDYKGLITSYAFESTGITRVETNAYSISGFAFAYCSSLSAAYLSRCKTLNKIATFFSCPSLTTVSLPVCTIINSQIFQNCDALKTVYSPQVLKVGQSAFKNCRNLSVISLPKCSVLGNGAFYYTDVYKHRPLSIYIPVCESYGNHCFDGRNLYIEDMDFTSCTYIGDYAFIEALGYISSTIDFPNCSYIGSYAFHNCALRLITLSNISYIGDMAFALHQEYISMPIRYVYIFTSSVCTLGGSMVFSTLSNGTWRNGATIYVPSSLVNEYKTAPYWSDISGAIYPIN